MKAREVRERLNKEGIGKDSEVRKILESLAERQHLTRQQLLEVALQISTLADHLEKVVQGTGAITKKIDQIKKRLPGDDDDDGLPTGVEVKSEDIH